MPLITFLTDYGLNDSYVAEVKGVLLSRVPDATIVDITHLIPPGDIRSAAWSPPMNSSRWSTHS